jgi:hypothetical protein
MRGRAGSTGNDLDAPAHMDPKVRRAGPLILYFTGVRSMSLLDMVSYHRIHLFLGLLDPDPDLDHSIIMQKK